MALGHEHARVCHVLKDVPGEDLLGASVLERPRGYIQIRNHIDAGKLGLVNVDMTLEGFTARPEIKFHRFGSHLSHTSAR